MVDRTRYGEVVDSTSEDNDEIVINTGPIGQPLLLIFLEDKKELLGRLEVLPSIFYWRTSKIGNFMCSGGSVIVYIPFDEIESIVGGLNNISQRVLVVSFDNEKLSFPDNYYKLDFEGKSDDYIFEYLKELLRVE